jgi:DNA-binding transcriptional regulator YhcF (GntR family)
MDTDRFATDWSQVDTSEIDPDGVVPAYLQVAVTVSWHVIQWQLPVGTPLPPEHELAELFGVHRDTVRRAFDILRRYGMLETRRGTGTFVKFRADMQHVTVAHGSRITVRRTARSHVAQEALTPVGRALYSPIITVEEPGKPPAHYDSAATVISVWDEDA